MRRRRPIYAAGIIERLDHHVLIALASGSEEHGRLWQFPRGPAELKESAEAAMRRVAKQELGIEVEVVVGQPPLVEEIDGQAVELRYFFCDLTTGVPQAGSYDEIRWVSKAHLREYDFDRASTPVVQWLLESST